MEDYDYNELAARMYHPFGLWGDILDSLMDDRDAFQLTSDPRLDCQWEQAYTAPCHDHILIDA